MRRKKESGARRPALSLSPPLSPLSSPLAHHHFFISATGPLAPPPTRRWRPARPPHTHTRSTLARPPRSRPRTRATPPRGRTPLLALFFLSPPLAFRPAGAPPICVCPLPDMKRIFGTRKAAAPAPTLEEANTRLTSRGDTCVWRGGRGVRDRGEKERRDTTPRPPLHAPRPSPPLLPSPRRRTHPGHALTRLSPLSCTLLPSAWTTRSRSWTPSSWCTGTPFARPARARPPTRPSGARLPS